MHKAHSHWINAMRVWLVGMLAGLFCAMRWMHCLHAVMSCRSGLARDSLRAQICPSSTIWSAKRSELEVLGGDCSCRQRAATCEVQQLLTASSSQGQQCCPSELLTCSYAVSKQREHTAMTAVVMLLSLLPGPGNVGANNNV